MTSDLPERGFVITGGPGAGKTSLIAELRARGFVCADETGRAVIRDQLACGGSRLPWADPAGFARSMLALDLLAWRRAAALPGPVFFDRGIPDVIGYLRVSGIEVPDRFHAHARRLRYAPRVFIAPFWAGIYRTDEERKQTPEEAVRTCAALIDTYRGLGYDIRMLPRTDVRRRADFVLKEVADLSRA